VLESLCAELELPADLTYYFTLVVVEFEGASSRNPRIVRTMQHFESPYISLKRSGLENQQIQLRKAFWDTSLEAELLE
jgi:hypothetical protein